MITPRNPLMSRSIVTVPPGTKFLVVKGGRVRHATDKEPTTWCNMVWERQPTEPYRMANHGQLPICGACLRTTRARI